MADLYGDFNDSDDMEENDEEIGALGSILSWDDEEDVGVGAEVAAAAAIDGRDSLSKDTLPMLPGYPQQISILPSAPGPAAPAPAPTPQQQQQRQPPQPMEGYQLVSVPIGYMNQSHHGHPHHQGSGAVGSTPSPLSGQVHATQMQLVTTHGGVQMIAAPAPGPTPATAAPGPAGASRPIPTTAEGKQVQQGIMAGAPTPGAPSTVTQHMINPSTGAPQILNPATANPLAGTYTIYHQQPQIVAAGNRGGTILQHSPVQTTQAQAGTATATDPNSFLHYKLPHPAPGTVAAPAPSAAQHRQVHPTASRVVSMSQGQHIMPAQTGPPSTQGTISTSLPKRGIKRKSDVKAVSVSSQVRAGIVSASDTDGETKTLPSGKVAKKSSGATASSKKKSPALALADLDKDGPELTQEEKAKANRDRNREHARNTRLRKKAYLEKLKSTVDELCRERDTLVTERAGAANLMVEIHNTRVEVLMSFFALRSTYEKQRDLWSSILDESCFSCVVPVTPYRSFPASEVQVSKCQRTVLGIDGMMADTASLHVLLGTLIDRSRYPTGSIQFRYTLVTEDAVVAGNQMMARWAMSTLNATQLGARMEVAKQGMLCCKFNSAHKIIGLELMFDVMAFMLQLKQAAGSETFSVVPNTVQTCQRSFTSPMVMTLAERPYTIVQVNKLWEDMTGYKAEDVVGKASCRILQGQDTNKKAVDSLMLSVRYKRPASTMLVNYTRAGKRFHNYLDVYPLSTDSKITHYVALTAHSCPFDGKVPQAAATTIATTAPQSMPLSVGGNATKQVHTAVSTGPTPAPGPGPAPAAQTPTPAPRAIMSQVKLMPHPPSVPAPMQVAHQHPPPTNTTAAGAPSTAVIGQTGAMQLPHNHSQQQPQPHHPHPASAPIAYYVPQPIVSTATAIIPKAGPSPAPTPSHSSANAGAPSTRFAPNGAPSPTMPAPAPVQPTAAPNTATGAGK